MATTITGGEKILAKEVLSLRGAHSIVEAKAQVFFQGSSETGLEAIMNLRTSLRVLERLLDEDEIYTKNDLYSFISSFDWSSIVSCDNTIKCDVILGQVANDLTHSHFTALTVKNAVVDQMRARHGRRPSVEINNPDLPLLLYLHRGRAILYRAWSGEGSMHKRGYRNIVHRAALRETTAAVLLKLTDWDSSSTILCDPLCGSGTILIEAALLASSCAPGLIKYGRMGESKPVPLLWKDIECCDSLWQNTQERAAELDKRTVISKCGPIIFGNDIHPGALGLAKHAALIAGVDKLIHLDAGDVRDYRPDIRPGLAITNPPWNVRLEEAPVAWNSLGEFARRELVDGVLWALCGNPAMSKFSKLKSHLKIPLIAASVDMRFLKYEIRDDVSRTRA